MAEHHPFHENLPFLIEQDRAIGTLLLPEAVLEEANIVLPHHQEVLKIGIKGAINVDEPPPNLFHEEGVWIHHRLREIGIPLQGMRPQLPEVGRAHKVIRVRVLERDAVRQQGQKNKNAGPVLPGDAVQDERLLDMGDRHEDHAGLAGLLEHLEIALDHVLPVFGKPSVPIDRKGIVGNALDIPRPIRIVRLDLIAPEVDDGADAECLDRPKVGIRRVAQGAGAINHSALRGAIGGLVAS